MNDRKDQLIRKIVSMLMLVVLIELLVGVYNFNYVFAKSGTDLKVGDYVSFGYYDANENGKKEDNEKITWRVIHVVTGEESYKNKYKNYNTGDVLLLADKIICFKVFDAKDKSAGGYRDLNGSNNWKKSNIRKWLNSDSMNMSTSTYGGSGQAPTSGNIYQGYNPYNYERGFLSNANFTDFERSVIRQVGNRYIIDKDSDEPDGNSSYEHKYDKSQPYSALKNYDDSAYQYCEDRVFLLSIKEVANYICNNLTYKNGDYYHKAYPTENAASNCDYEIDDTQFYEYLLRDAKTAEDYSIRTIRSDGVVNRCRGYSNCGIRPALYVNANEILASGEGENSLGNPYNIIDPNDVIRPTGVFNPNEDIVSNKPITVTFDPIDHESGVVGWNYAISNDGGKTYSKAIEVEGDTTKEIVLNSDGIYKIKTCVFDVAGNDNELYSKVYTIDTIKPSAPVISYNPKGLTNLDVEVSINFSSESYVREYKTDGGEWKKYNNKFIINKNCTILARSKDKAGNYSDQVTCNINNIDKTVPSDATFKLSTTELTNKDVIVTINYAEDVVKKEYKIGESSEFISYDNSIVVEKNCTIYVRGYDAAENESNITSISITNIDKEKPENPVITYNPKGITNNNVTVNISYSDDSNIKEYKINDESWKIYTNSFDINKNCKILARSQDEAKNYSEEVTCNINNIDKTVPSDATFKLSTTEATNKNVIVTINYADDVVKKEYKIGESGSFISYVNPVEIDKNCTIYVRGYDNAGNESNIVSISITNIDKQKPKDPVISYNPKERTNKEITISIEYFDENITKEYKIDDGSWKVYTGSFLIGENCMIVARSKDKAGNISNEVTNQITNILKKKLTMPIINMSSGVYYNEINVEIIKGGSDTKKIYYTLDETEPDNSSIEYKKKIKIDGSHNNIVILKAVAYDESNNKSNIAQREYTFNKELINLDENDKKNFRYYVGINQWGMIKVMLVSKTGKDLGFDKSDILETNGNNINCFKDGIYYIDRYGYYKVYKINNK